MLQVLGPITVPVPGVPIRSTIGVTQNAGGNINDPLRFTCYAALFQAMKGNVGNVYIGLQSMNRSSGVGVAAVLPIPTTNQIPAFGISLTISPAGVDLSNLFIDADSAGDGVLLTILVT